MFQHIPPLLWAIIVTALAAGMALSAWIYVLTAWVREYRDEGVYTVVFRTPDSSTLVLYAVPQARNAQEALHRVLRAQPSGTVGFVVPGDWSDLQHQLRKKP